MEHGGVSLDRTAFSATVVHCLTGCAIGEVLGMIIGTALGWGDVATIALAVTLAFFFGYSLTMLPLLRSGLALGTVLPLAFASDTISITVMEIVDNVLMLAIPDAMEAGLTNTLFWGSLAVALVVAVAIAFPVNRSPTETCAASNTCSRVPRKPTVWTWSLPVRPSSSILTT
jgi:hypothetical protein